MDDTLLQELQTTRRQLNAHLLDLRRELDRVRQSMIASGDRPLPSWVEGDDDEGPAEDRLAEDRLRWEQRRTTIHFYSDGDEGRPALPLPSRSAAGLPPSPYWLPRFPRQPTLTTMAGLSPSPRDNSISLPQEDDSPEGYREPPTREFDVDRSTRGSVRLLSSTQPRPLSSSNTNTLLSPSSSTDSRPDQRREGWSISWGPGPSSSSSSSPTQQRRTELPSSSTSPSSRPPTRSTAAGEDDSATTRQTSNLRSVGSSGRESTTNRVPSLLFGTIGDLSSSSSGEGGVERRDRLRRTVDNFRAAFLPRTVNVPPPRQEGLSDRPGLGLYERPLPTSNGQDDPPRVDRLGEGRPRPDPPREVINDGGPRPPFLLPVYASGETIRRSGPFDSPQNGMAGELDPNGEAFLANLPPPPPLPPTAARSTSSSDRREPSSSTETEQVSSEPSVWSTLPLLPPTPIPDRVESFSSPPTPPFGAPSFDRASTESQRRMERTAGLLEELEERRERLRTTIDQLSLETDRRRQAAEREFSRLTADSTTTGVGGGGREGRRREENLRPPEESTPVGSPALPHRTTGTPSARLLSALGPDGGLEEVQRRIEREMEREWVRTNPSERVTRSIRAGGEWEGWGGSTSGSSVAREGVWRLTANATTDERGQGETLRRVRETNEYLRRRGADGPSATRERSAQVWRSGGDEPTTSRRNEPWTFGDGAARGTATRSGQEARFWPNVQGPVIFDVPRSQAETLLTAGQAWDQPLYRAYYAPVPSSEPTHLSHPWRDPTSATSTGRSQGIYIRARTPPPGLHAVGGRGMLDPNGDLFSACPSRPSTAGGAGDVVLGAGAGRGRAARGKRADEGEGREEWFERPGPVDLPGYLKEEEESQRRFFSKAAG